MILSVHPRHVANMISGQKTVELRRTRPSVESGQPVALYATAPVSAVVATCTLESVRVEAPEILKASVLRDAQISSKEYDSYFAHRSQAVAMFLTSVSTLPVPITLGEMRATDSWHPPQTWQFVPHNQLTRLFGAHASLKHLGALL